MSSEGYASPLLCDQSHRGCRVARGSQPLRTAGKEGQVAKMKQDGRVRAACRGLCCHAPALTHHLQQGNQRGT